MALPVQDIFVIPLAVLEDQIYSLEEVPKYHFAGSILNPCPFTKVGWGNAIGHIDPFTFHAVKRDDPNAPSKTSAPKVKDVFIKPYAIAHNKYPFEFNRIKNNEEQARLLLNQIAPLHTRSFPIITDYDELKTKQKDPSVGFLCNLVKVFEGFACIRNIDPKYFEDTKIDPDEKAKNDADKSLLYAEQRFERRGSRVYSRLNDKDFSTDLGHVLVVGYQQDITTPSVVQHPRGDFFIVSESATVSRGGAGLSRTEFTSIPIDVLITEPKSMVGNLVSFNLPLTPATTVKGMKVADSGIWSVGYLTTSFDGVYRPVVPLIPPDSSPLPPRTPPQPPQPPGPPDGPKCDPRPPSPRKSPKPPRTIPREPKPVPQDPREDCRVKPPPEDPVDDCRQWVPWTPGGGEIPADRRKPGDRRINEFYVKDKDLFPRTPSIEVDESLGIEAPDWMYPRRGEIEGKIRNAGYELFGVWSNPEEPELEFVNIDWGHTALQPARPAYTWLDRRERLGAGVFLPSADLLPVGGVKLIDALDFNTSHTILDVLVYYADKINQLITAHNHAHPFYGSVKEGVGAYFGRYTSPPSPVYFLPGSIILGETETLDGNIIPDLQYLSDDRGVKEWINFSISGFPENIRGRGDITESIWDLYYTGRHTSKNQFPRIGWNNSKGVFEISQDGKTVDFNDLLKLREGSFEVKETPPDVTVKWLDSTGQKVTVTVHPGKVLDSTDTELIEIASDISFTIDYTTSTYEKADYFTGSGTVSVAAGSNAITGTNTRFLTEFGPLKRGGKKITGQIQTSEIASTTVTIIGGKLLTKREVQPYDLIGNSVDGYYRVVSIDSETTLTISTAKAFFNSTAEVIYFPVIYLGPGTWTHVDRIISDTTLYTTDSFASSYTNVNYTIGYYDPYLMDGNLTVFALKGQNGVDISWGISRDGPYGRAGYDEHYKVLGYIIVTSTPAVFSKGSVVYKWGDQRIFMKWSSHNALTHPPAAGEIIFDAVNLALAMEAGDGS